MMDERRCRECGCTDARACPGGCFWVAPDLCSACAIGKVTTIDYKATEGLAVKLMAHVRTHLSLRPRAQSTNLEVLNALAFCSAAVMATCPDDWILSWYGQAVIQNLESLRQDPRVQAGQLAQPGLG